MKILRVKKKQYKVPATSNANNCGSTGSSNCGSCAHSTDCGKRVTE
jgi:hypothetical protein